MMDRDRVIGGLALLKVPFMNEPLAQDILDSAIALLKEQPEIGRCKNCNHSTEWYGDKRRCFLWAESGIDVFENGYCSYWKPKAGKSVK